MGPNYKKIYSDIVREKFPEMVNDRFLKEKIRSIRTAMDIIDVNELIFRETKNSKKSENQKLRSYDKYSILKVIEFQRKNQLSNVQTGMHFNISRRTIGKWNRIFKSK